MMKSNSCYMWLHAKALFTRNENEELMAVREPWNCTSHPAPRFYLARPLYEKAFAYFRTDVSKNLREQLQKLVDGEPALVRPNEAPAYIEEYKYLLRGKDISEEACFWIPQQPYSDASILTADNIGTQADYYFPYLTEELQNNSFCAVYLKNTQVVSICRSVRIIQGAEEAGIETNELYRRRGYAFQVLAKWSETVRQNGSIPLYSACISNTASLNLAKKAGSIFFGNGFSIK